MRRFFAGFSSILIALSAMSVISSPSHASAVSTSVITCTNLATHNQVVLRPGQSNCSKGFAKALWHLQDTSAAATQISNATSIQICSSSNPDHKYQVIRTTCPKYEISKIYVRVQSIPQTPKILSAESTGGDSIKLVLDSVEPSESPIAYYSVENSVTKSTTQVLANNLGTLEITSLSPGISYQFSITAGNVDGLAKNSSKSFPVSTRPLSEADLMAIHTGMVGPGGGTVFYFSATGFPCGPTLENTCHYQEFAPNTWKSTPRYPILHAVRGAYLDQSVPAFNGFYATNESIGGGYPNSLAYIAQNGDCDSIATCDYAFGTVAKYVANGFSDWYVPDTLEAQQICKFVNGQPWVSNATVCSDAGTPDSAKFELRAGYLTSNQENNSMYKYFNLANGHFAGTGKPDQAFVIPIRSY